MSEELITFVLALIALPIVCASQRFAVAYGYEGLSRAAARHSAWQALRAVGMLSLLLSPLALRL